MVALFVLKRRGAQGSTPKVLALLCEAARCPRLSRFSPRLVAACPDHIVLPSPGVSCSRVKKGFNHHEWNNRIKSPELRLCGVWERSTVLAAIELDDKTHEAASRTQTNKKKDRRRLQLEFPLFAGT